MFLENLIFLITEKQLTIFLVPKALIRSKYCRFHFSVGHKNKAILPLKATRDWQKNQALLRLKAN